MFRWLALFFAATTVACAHAGAGDPATASGEPPVAGPLDYERAQSWLCRPDLPADACRGDLDVTELWPDGKRVVVPFAPAADTKVDCFYVYPTVDLKMVADDHTDFADNGQIVETTRAQVARFGEACRVFAPVLQADDDRHLLHAGGRARASLPGRVRRRGRRVPLVPGARRREPAHRARRPLAGRADDRAAPAHDVRRGRGAALAPSRRDAHRGRRRGGRWQHQGRHVPEHPAVHGRRSARDAS